MSANLQVDGNVAILTIARPQALNTLDLATLKALRGHLADFRDRDDLRVCIVTGEGGKAFCAGADLKGTAVSAASYPEAMFRETGTAAERGLYIRLMDLAGLDLWKPVIAAVNGYCLGGGLELALQCDIRVASSTARFGLPEAAVASIPAVSGLHRLLRAVPGAHAMKMALTASHIDAQQALGMGLVSDVFAPDALIPGAMEIARRIARNGPLALQAIKRLARQTAHLSDTDAQQLTELYWGALRDTQDRVEGRQAFAEKRDPRYAGR
ncbi:enoyl-CoA hydratase/isomerase family protein [Cupriavidus sp. 2TAF22]|uniref:enoyl-CoA hydratase/isomerase family protein n=1 Tax=unclassified Cupriavidus TaxID=2640874 RepID=UPI003F90E584